MPNQKMPNFYLCESCDFKCCKKSNYYKHLLTLKHKNLQNPTLKNAENADFVKKLYLCCYCDKKYKHSSSYYSHKKKCSHLSEITNVKNTSKEEPEESEDSLVNYTNEHDLVIHLLNQNKQLQEQIIELCKDKNHITNNNNMINSHNKTFNLHVFLNETCKDAMNLTDFVNSLQIQLSDLEKVGKEGFVNGITNIIVKNLKALDVTMRPVHCSDQKREVVYVKDDNEWHNDSKELPENQKLKKAIKQVVHKNICMIPEWKKMYPDCIYAESRKSDLYNHIMYESMDHNETNSEKIIKKIAKEVVIDKN
jgi:hypothetical protein